jgi:hypothetical protein
MNSLIAVPAARVRRTIVWAAAAFAVAMVAGALLLWAHLGSAVFFEAIRAGIAYCF